MADNVTLLGALFAGLASFLLPCVIPLVPVYFASLYGPEVFDAETRRRFPLFLHSSASYLASHSCSVPWGPGPGSLDW